MVMCGEKLHEILHGEVEKKVENTEKGSMRTPQPIPALFNQSPA